MATPALAHANAKGHATAAATSITANFLSGYTATAGDLIVGLLSRATTAGVNTPGGYSLHSAYPDVSSANNKGTWLFLDDAAGGETGLTVTVSDAGTNRMTLEVFAITGVDAAGIKAETVPLTVATPNDIVGGGGTSNASGAIDPTPTGDVLFIATVNFSGAPSTAPSWDNSFTAQHIFLTAARQYSAMRTVTNPGSISTTATWTGTLQSLHGLIAIPGAVDAAATVPFRGYPRALTRGSRR